MDFPNSFYDHLIKEPCPKCNEIAMEITLELIIKCFNCGNEIIPSSIIWNSPTYLMRSKNSYKGLYKG